MVMYDRYEGSLLGLAIGDALGASIESKSRGTFEPVSDMIGGGQFDLLPGQWTDDTSQALCLAESLVTKKEFDQTDQLNRLLKWYREGYLSSKDEAFSIGPTTSESLERFERDGTVIAPLKKEGKATNGSLMRLAPVPLAFALKPELAIEYGGKSSISTHNSTVAIDACRYMSSLIVGASMGVRKDILLSEFYCPYGDYWNSHRLCPEIEMIARGSFKKKSSSEIRTTMDVTNTLEAALWAFYNTDNFEDGCLLVVNLGDDADTSGAVYGQLAGAYYGRSGIPSHWQSKLFERELIVSYARQLTGLFK